MNDARTIVLILCTGNSAHNQMVKAYLRHYADDKAEETLQEFPQTRDQIDGHERDWLAQIGVTVR